MNEVIMTAAAVVLGNLLTVWFIYCMYHLTQREKQGKRLPIWLCWGGAFPLLFSAGAVYLAAG